MGIIKLIERTFLGKKIFKESEEIREKIRDMKRRQESEEYKKEMLAAYNENMRISAETRKKQKETWKLIREIKRKYPKIFVSEIIEKGGEI